MNIILLKLLVNSISAIHRRGGCHDGWVWLGDENQQYTVRSVYIILNRKNQNEKLEVFEKLWKCLELKFGGLCWIDY